MKKEILFCILVILSVNLIDIPTAFGGIPPKCDKIFFVDNHQSRRLRTEVLGPLRKIENEAGKRDFITLEIKQVSSVPTENHTDSSFSFKNGKLNFSFLFDQNAFQNPERWMLEALMFHRMTSDEFFEIKGLSFDPQGLWLADSKVYNVFQFVELIQNAKLGSVSAQNLLLQWKIDLIESLRFDSDFFDAQMQAKFHDLKLTLHQQKSPLVTKKSKKFSLSQIRKIKTLVAKNDRLGVAGYLNEILDWDAMQPIEKQVWNNWLEAIAHPNTTDVVWAYRGLQFEEVAAINSFDSSIFSRFLGNLDAQARGLSPDGQLADLMHAHANAELENSPFISLTLSFDKAEFFVGGSELFPGPPGDLLAVRMDRRRVIANLPSPQARELELLVPLMIFPDEVMVYEKNYDRSSLRREQFFRKVQQLGGPSEFSTTTTTVEEFRSLGRSFFGNHFRAQLKD